MRTKPARFAKGSPFGTSPGRGKMSPVGDKKGNELSSAARLRGFVPEATLSVTASPCHLSRKGEALARVESLQLISWILPAVDEWRTKLSGSAKGSPFGRAVERSETERVRSGRQPSPSRLCRATSPERERLWQGRKAYRLSADFFLPLTNEDETLRFCQGLALRESWQRR